MADFFDRKTVVLTGASSGIGLALARHLTNRGATVLASGGRAEANLPADFPDIAYAPVDLARDDCADRLADAVSAQGWKRTDIVILNAGVGRHAPISDERPADIAETVAVNFGASVRIAHRFAASLAESRGSLVLIGSTAHGGAPDFPVYAATKAALSGFARALRSEWRDRIDVQIIHPGPTRTPMHQRAGHDPGRIARLFMSAEVAATLIASAMVRGRPSATIGAGARVAGRLRPSVGS